MSMNIIDQLRQDSYNITLTGDGEEGRSMALASNINPLFQVIMGLLIMLMQPGFAFLEVGSVRSKNATNIMIKNVLDIFVAGIAYWILGFAFAYGKGNSFIGWHYWASDELYNEDLAFFFFEFVFAATAATVVSGALAERHTFHAYIIYSFALTAFIYPVVTHWVWSGEGWLSQGIEYEIDGVIERIGYHDFSGSGCVHAIGGISAFVGAYMLGPRIGRFHHPTKTTINLRGHSVPFAALGGFLLVFGFIAFNGGSQLTVTNPGDGGIIALSCVNTVISGSMAALTSMVLRRIFGRTWSLLYTINGSIAGMVASCAGCDVFRPWGALIVGMVAAINFNVVSKLMVKLKIDDPLDAVAVHFGGGSWGVISVAFLRYDTGILMSWDKRSGLLLAWQLCGMAAIIAWTGGLSIIMFGAMKLLGIFRVSEEVEKKGLDIPKHGEPAYPLESYGHGYMEKIFSIKDNGELSRTDIGYNTAMALGAFRKDSGYYESPEQKAMKHVNIHRSTPNLEVIVDPPSRRSSGQGPHRRPSIQEPQKKSSTEDPRRRTSCERRASFSGESVHRKVTPIPDPVKVVIETENGGPTLRTHL